MHELRGSFRSVAIRKPAGQLSTHCRRFIKVVSLFRIRSPARVPGTGT